MKFTENEGLSIRVSFSFLPGPIDCSALDELRSIIKSTLNVSVNRECVSASANRKDAEVLTALNIACLAINAVTLLYEILNNWRRTHPQYETSILSNSRRLSIDSFRQEDIPIKASAEDLSSAIQIQIDIKLKRLVLCYHTDDSRLKESLVTHLDPMVREGLVTLWDIQHIRAGQNIHAEVVANVGQADILILLISASFLQAAPWRAWIELAQRRSAPVLVIPVLARPALWRQGELTHMQCLPQNGIPIASWQRADEACHEVATAILGLVRGGVS